MEQKVKVCLEPLDLRKVVIQVEGKTPLLMDRFPEEAQQQILDKQIGISKSSKKKTRDVDKEVQEAVHRTNKGEIGYPAHGFKAGMMECTSFVGDKFFSKKLVSGALKIVNVVDGLIPLNYGKQDVLQHNIQHNVKFSPQFHDWNCTLEIEYDANNIAVEDIVRLLNYAGHYVGVGAWRPKGARGSSGSYGTYGVSIV